MAKAKRQPQRPQPKQPASGGAASGASSRLASIRQASGTGSGGRSSAAARSGRPQPSRYAQPPWWQRNLFALGTVGAVVVLIAAFIIFAQIQNQRASQGIGAPVSASVMRNVSSVSPTVFAKVGAGTALKVFQATPKGTALLTADGKPEIVYIGAEWCPYCAATRWSTVVALSRFGSFSGLEQMRSTTSDAYPSTATFSFRNATYTSKYITFTPTEDADRSGARLATPGPSSAQALAHYDIPPYTTQAGGVPFMSYGNQYVTTAGLYAPSMLQDMDWEQISSQLNDPNSNVTKAIVGGANMQTAAICKLTNDQPGDVCGTPVIQQLEATLPQAK